MNKVPRRRLLIRILVALAVLVAVGAVGFLLVPDDVEPIEYYRLVEPDTIAIGTYTGGATWTRVTDVSETESEVLIVVKSRRFPFIMGPAIAYPIELTVTLDGPLGDRVVMETHDQRGEVPRMSCDDLKDFWRRVASC